MFSFGVILWSFLTWRGPWEELGQLHEVASAVCEGRRLPIPSQEMCFGAFRRLSGFERFTGLIQRCWVQDPEARPSFKDIITELR